MDILITTDENYVKFAQVTIASLLANNSSLSSITIHCIEIGLSEGAKAKFNELVEGYNQTIRFYDGKSIISFLSDNNAKKYRNSYMAYVRLFFETLLPNDVERLLYLDSDLIINDSISELLKINLDNHPYAACRDCNGVLHNYYGIDSHLYFNTGVILFNCDYWRKHKCTETILKFLVNNTDVRPDADQFVTNTLFANEVLPLDLKYNFGASFLTYGIENSAYVYDWTAEYSREMEKAKNEAVIYHCFPIYGRRPWHRNAHYPKQVRWDKYFQSLGYCEKDKLESTSQKYVCQKILHCFLPVKIYKKLHNHYFIKEMFTGL